MGDSVIQIGTSPVGFSGVAAPERGDRVYRLTGFVEYGQRIGKQSSKFFWRVAPEYQLHLLGNQQHIFALRGGLTHLFAGIDGLVGVTYQGDAVTGGSLNLTDLTRMIIPGFYVGYEAIWKDSVEHRLDVGLRWAWPVCFDNDCPF